MKNQTKSDCARITSKCDVSILMVNYNSKKLATSSILSVISETKLNSYEIIVVDNSPDEGLATDLSELSENVRLYPMKTNIGFAAATNLGATRARGDLLLLLNPDTLVLNGAIDKLIDFSREHQKSRIWGGRTIFANGQLNPYSTWRRQSYWGLFSQAMGLNSVFRNSSIFNFENYGGWDRRTKRNVDIVQGSFLLIDKALWVALGGFREKYFMYGEEADLCLRAKAMGASPMFCPSSEIIHYSGASSSTPSKKLILILKAKVTLIKDHFPKRSRRIAIALLSFWPYSRFAFYTLLLLPSFAVFHSAYFGIRDSREKWRKVWSCREEWTAGFPDNSK